MFAETLFLGASLIAIVASVGMLVSRSPVRSALWLILTLIVIAGLYLTLQADFIAVIQVLVYAGAIMVLFLFVIMLLNLGEMPDLERVDFKKGVGFVLGVAVLTLLTYIGTTAALDFPASSSDPATTGTATAIAKSLFTQYALPFEMIGILLLLATIGAVMLAKRTFE
ncbi:MAG: NADH-quinone oxidoreductase subunit J [Bacteroidota bacterium]|nr:NADH-quinone oxidoreductase subunit J [Bacteroidota bacterium]MDE2834076.1 NADH-quinone oxidoreductase subunit J [Bacteroidota bacterium]MDE2955425.1 NADH-quinone oxidoreductase subunit J [Bacteroidota bacterium]